MDWRYLSDALTPAEAVDLLEAARPGRDERIAHLREHGNPAYTTSPGWLGYSDEKLVRLAREAVADGYTQIKLKVGQNLDDDLRRMALARRTVCAGIRIAVDANQTWDVGVAIDWMTALAPYDPWWIEEPTSPDDVLGHAAIRRGLRPYGIGVATGEHAQNRIIFKQLLQAEAIDVVQLDACRVVEYVDHLHEHFVNPVVIRDGAYQVPRAPGFSARMKPESLRRFAYPDGPAWA